MSSDVRYKMVGLYDINDVQRRENTFVYVQLVHSGETFNMRYLPESRIYVIEVVSTLRSGFQKAISSLRLL